MAEGKRQIIINKRKVKAANLDITNMPFLIKHDTHGCFALQLHNEIMKALYQSEIPCGVSKTNL